MLIQSSTPENAQLVFAEPHLEYPQIGDVQALIDELQVAVNGVAHVKNLEFADASALDNLHLASRKMFAWTRGVRDATHSRRLIPAFEIVSDIVAWAEAVWAGIAQDEKFSDEDFFVKELTFRGERLNILFEDSDSAFVVPERHEDAFTVQSNDIGDDFLYHFGPDTAEPEGIDSEAVTEAERKWNAVPETDPVEVFPFVNVWTRGDNLVGLAIDSDDALLDADDVNTLISALQGAVAQLGATE